jgi:hypothetical protein
MGVNMPIGTHVRLLDNVPLRNDTKLFPQLRFMPGTEYFSARSRIPRLFARIVMSFVRAGRSLTPGSGSLAEFLRH